MAASLPDCTMSPFSSSSTVAGDFGSTNMREPIALCARVDTGGRCARLMRFCLRASNTT
jgi:hypothetical protein